MAVHTGPEHCVEKQSEEGEKTIHLLNRLVSQNSTYRQPTDSSRSPDSPASCRVSTEQTAIEQHINYFHLTSKDAIMGVCYKQPRTRTERNSRKENNTAQF